MASVFERPRFSRGMLQPAGVGQMVQQVETFEQFVAALGRIQSTFSTGEVQDANIPRVGGEIIITKPILADRTIKLPPSAAGVLIRGAGRLTPIIFTALVARAFLIDAPAVQIANLWIQGKTTALHPGIGFEIDAANLSLVAGQNCTFRDCAVFADRLFVDTVGALDALIDNNRFVKRADVGSLIEINTRCSVHRNILDGVTGFAGIEMTGGSRASIKDNMMDSTDIDTSASGGSNVVGGNRGCLDLTMPNLHLSDASFGNT